jgi:signal transduction histidine kinase
MLRSGTFQFKLLAAFALLLALIVIPSGMSWWALERSAHYTERRWLAHNVLDHHLMLAERGQRLLRYKANPALSRTESEAELRSQITEQIVATRAAIAEEVALIGRNGATEEVSELERLDAIQASLWRAAAGDDDSRWRALIESAVTEEQHEVEQVDQAMRRIFGLLRLTFAADAVLAVAIGAFLFFRLRHAFKRPIERLVAGTRALAGGDLSHRIGLEGNDEFAALSNSFDKMAAELEAQSATITRSRDLLEETVAERTESLRKANAELAEAADRRRRFLADVSHELRTPLTIIRGEAEVTLRGADKPVEDYRSALARIATQTTGMARLVDDLLFVARNDEGQPRLVLRRVEAAPLVAKCIEDLRAVVERDGGTIAYEALAGPAKLIADPDRLRQLIYILVDNAIRYAGGIPRIDVTIAEAPGGYALRVADRGLGIAPEELPVIFDRFRRGTTAAKSNDQGLGIGLPMAKAIVEAHQGSITIDSELGEGTVVTVFLPGDNGRLRAVA